MQFLAAVVLALVYKSFAAIINDVKDLPRQQFDFIVVGGGTAGNVVANRLTENPAFQVLVLEAGPTNDGVLDIEVPGLVVSVTPDTPWDWNFTTTAQTGLGGRPLAYPRGHVLGGSSCANYMMYTRGSSDDWNRFASTSGDNGWSWNNILPYFKKFEKWTTPADNHNTAGEFNPRDHSSVGLVANSLSGFPTPIDSRVINAIHTVGGVFQFNLDYNSGSPLGMGFLQSTVDSNGVRSSSAVTYLAPQFLKRPNLHVLLNTRVSKLLKTGNGIAPEFLSVQFAQNNGAGPLNTLTATREIILSAGAIGTPQILLNSGIGNSKDLKAVGVNPIVDLPDVGTNLTDHPVVGNAWVVNSTDTFEASARDPTIEAKDISLWRKKTGPFVNTVVSHVGFMRLPPTIKRPNPDTPAGPNSPHYEIFVSNGLPIRDVPPAGNFLAIGTVVVSPSSRGSVKLNSNNPFDMPLIDPGLLTTADDVETMRQAIRSAVEFISAPEWADYVLAPTSPVLTNNATDADIDAYITANGGTIFHPVGTAKMSPKGASHGVVDPDLTVKKVTGLRIVDASVMPFIPSGHTQAATYAIAERASDLIKARHS